MKKTQLPIILGTLFVVTACTISSNHALNQFYGDADSTRYDAPVVAVRATDIDYWNDVKPILDSRCVVCHGCHDSPAQFNLGSYEGLARGASKEKVYEGARLLAAKPSRLFIDASSTSQWREKGFYPMLNERDPSLEADQQASVMHRMLRLKKAAATEQHNQPLADKSYDFSLSRKQVAPLIEEMDTFEIKYPESGMPYGLPQLPEDEYATLLSWIEAGAPYKPSDTLDAESRSEIEKWETFLNQDSLKGQLMARYIYEHWFLAHLYFEDYSSTRFFHIVRSRTKPGEPVDLIATRRPYDDPGVERVYYRIEPVPESILAKTHMPYALSKDKMRKIKNWFLDTDYEVNKLPSYNPKIASNPFKTFSSIPTDSKYRFMLEEARFTIMGFIKGPVCRGQIALNVINDHFWVVFADPDNFSKWENSDGIVDALANIRLPAENGSTSGILGWERYAKPQMKYLREKNAYINEALSDGRQIDLDLIWDGDGDNKNAALSIFRHSDTASIEFGLIGDNPQTVWVIEYPLLEKIHYLLVAGFDVYGNYGHQLSTRLYMDFLRMEGEHNFLTFLPKKSRNDLIEHWYRGDMKATKKYFEDASVLLEAESGIDFQTANPYAEMQTLLKDKLDKLQDNRFDYTALDLPQQTLESLNTLSTIEGLPLEHMPPVAFLSLARKNGKTQHLTLLHNNAHTNVAHILSEDKRRILEEDTLTLVNGFIGAYPNTFFKIEESELPVFVEKVQRLATAEDYRELLNNFGIRRTHTDFWPHSDEVHKGYKAWNPTEYGLLDYNRLENR